MDLEAIVDYKDEVFSPRSLSHPNHHTHQQTTAATTLSTQTTLFSNLLPTPHQTTKMKFTIVTSALAMAVSACATGTGGGSTGGSCNANTKQVCCNGLLNCAVQVLGKNCDGSAYCCKTEAPVVSTLFSSVSDSILTKLPRALLSTLPFSTVSTFCRGFLPGINSTRRSYGTPSGGHWDEN